MGYALLTALCWAFGGFGSSRISRHYGPARANGTRLMIASGVLALILVATGRSLSWTVALLFALSGFLHLTVGDIALFGTYRRLGPRMGVLMVCSLAPPTALIAEWYMLGTRLPPDKLLCAAGILMAVGCAVAPRERAHLSPHELKWGLLCGAVSGIGQGLGAALNRVAFEQNDGIGDWEAAFFRVLAGGAGVWAWVAILTLLGKRPLLRPDELIPHRKIEGHPWVWMGLSVAMGPVLGMMFLMKALASTPSGLVQAALSTLPVMMIPVAWGLDGNRPSLRSMGFGMIAVGLTAWLALM